MSDHASPPTPNDSRPRVNDGVRLFGVKSTANHLGTTERQCRYLVAQAALPVWREGRSILARRAGLDAWAITHPAAAREVGR